MGSKGGEKEETEGSCVGAESREIGKTGGASAAHGPVCGRAALGAVRIAGEFTCGGGGVRGGEAMCGRTGRAAARVC